MDRRTYLKLVGAAGAGLVIGYAGGVYSGQTFLKAPEQRNEPIVLGTWGGPQAQVGVEVGKQFYAQTGTPVLISEHGGPSGMGLAKIKAAWPDIVVDVFTSTKGIAYNAWTSGYLTTMTPEEVPSIKDIPEMWYQKSDQGIYAVGYETFNYCIARRTDKIPEELHSYADLYKPEYKGKIAIPDITYDAGWIVVSMGIPRGILDGNTPKDFELGKQALLELAQTGNIGGIFKTDAEMRNFLVSAEVPIVFGTGNGMYTAKKEGYPVEGNSILDDGPVLMGADRISVINGPRKDVAKQFVNLFLSPGIIDHVAGVMDSPSTSVNATFPDVLKGFALSAQDSAKHGVDIDVAPIDAVMDDLTTWFETTIVPLVGQS